MTSGGTTPREAPLSVPGSACLADVPRVRTLRRMAAATVIPRDVAQVTWPVGVPAAVFRVGRFTQDDRNFALTHQTGDLTIHLFAFAARVRIGGRTFAIEPGDITINPPGGEQRFDLTGTGMHWCIRLVPPPPGAPGPRLDLPLHHRLGPQALAARNRFEVIARDFRTANGDATHPAALAAAAGAQALLCWLAALGRTGAPPAHADLCVERATALLRAQECAGLPIAQIARRAGMSQNRLEQAFLARHGQTMVQFRTAFLIENVKWLMEFSDLPLAEIRKRFEIHDAHAFNKIFRRLTGLSPRAWMAEHAPVMRSSPRPPVTDGKRRTKPAQ